MDGRPATLPDNRPDHRVAAQADEYRREMADSGEIQLHDERYDKDRYEDRQVSPPPRPRDAEGEHGYHADQEVADPDILGVDQPFRFQVMPDRQIQQPFAEVGGDHVRGQPHREPTHLA